jgi:class 3 adenylate cyclase
LVLHARNDALVPYEAGRLLAASIPNARFVTLEGRNHILLETESAWPRFLHEVHNFVGISPVEVLAPKNKGSDSETSSRKAGAGNSRRLSAIMFLDIVSFTAMVQKNEAFALKLLEELGLLIRPVFRKYNGRQVKSMGDGFLAEFGSATEASLCAVEIQKTLYDRAKSLPQSEILVRIGIHLGDVEHKGKDIYGDSVNIASRIEPLAESGGICISEQVFFQIQNKTDFRIAKLGRQALKNVQFPMNVYKIVLPWGKEITPEKLSRTKSSIV